MSQNNTIGTVVASHALSEDSQERKDTGEICGSRTSRGYNQTTASGYPFWALDPRPEDIRIEDIAAHLSRICRFGGAVKSSVAVEGTLDGFYRAGEAPEGAMLWNVSFAIYSVAEHSVLVSRNVPQEFALEALLHHAAGAYVGDVIKPVKMLLEPDWRRVEADLAEEGMSYEQQGIVMAALQRSIGVPSFSRIEKRIDAVIRAKFGLPVSMSPEVKEADYRAVLTEHRDLQVDMGLVDWGLPSLEPWSERILPALPSLARNQFMMRFNELYKGDKG